MEKHPFEKLVEDTVQRIVDERMSDLKAAIISAFNPIEVTIPFVPRSPRRGGRKAKLTGDAELDAKREKKRAYQRAWLEKQRQNKGNPAKRAYHRKASKEHGDPGLAAAEANAKAIRTADEV